MFECCSLKLLLKLMFFGLFRVLFFSQPAVIVRNFCQKAVYHVAAENADRASYLLKSDESLVVLTSNIPKRP